MAEEAMRLDPESANDDMPARIRAFDWATTELGALATWPPPLAVMVDVVTAAALPMLLWWGDGAIQLYNDPARRALLGERDASALGAPAAGCWAAIWPRLEAAVTRVRAGGGAVVLDQVTLDGPQTWSFALSPVPDGRGGTGGVLVIARETTASAGLLEAYRDHLRALFLDAPAPICILRGPQYIVDVANKGMAAAFGFDLDAVLGRPALELSPEIRALFEPLLRDVYTSGEVRVIKAVQYRSELTADGRRLGLYANGLFAPLRDELGNVDGVLIIAVEITEEIRARDEMQRLRGEAEAANRAKDEFLAILGHELRNPLSPISTTLQVMRLRGMVGHELDVLERQVGHLTRLVDDLLDVSRVIRGKIELHRRDIELAELVAEALELSSPLLERRAHVVEVDVPRVGLCVHADRERMVQAISNLLTNAAKYSEPESRIMIRATRVNDRVRLAIRDRGAGIAPEMLRRVFDPFTQQPQTLDRALGGLGLGLSIVHGLVALHGGTVTAASAGVGQGSEFTIELAVRDQVSPTTPEVRPTDAAAHARAERTKILVVDDNEDAAMMLSDALAQLGYQIAVAHDGPSALQIAAGFAPDVALLDLGLPVMDGFELAARLREQPPPARCPHLVALTGYGQDTDRERTTRAGFERHLVKPVEIATLAAVVAELVTQPAVAISAEVWPSAAR